MTKLTERFVVIVALAAIVGGWLYSYPPGARSGNDLSVSIDDPGILQNMKHQQTYPIPVSIANKTSRLVRLIGTNEC